MSRPIHFEELPDGQWLASCRRCPGRFRAFTRLPSFAEANAWWKEHRGSRLHRAYAGEHEPSEEDVMLRTIFGED